RAVQAAVAIEARTPGGTGRAIEIALDDKSPSVRLAALDAVLARGETSGALLARALTSQDGVVRARAASALAALIKANPDLAPMLVAALGGPGRVEAEALIGRLL